MTLKTFALASLASAASLAALASAEPTCTTTITTNTLGERAIFTTTTTVYEETDCGGCALATYTNTFHDHLPVASTHTDPFTSTVVTCAPSPSANAAYQKSGAPSTFTTSVMTCPYTQQIPPAQVRVTSTAYASTVTATSSVNCHGCSSLVTSSIPVKAAPIVTATVFDSLTTTATTYVCQASY